VHSRTKRAAVPASSCRCAGLVAAVALVDIARRRGGRIVGETPDTVAALRNDLTQFSPVFDIVSKSLPG